MDEAEKYQQRLQAIAEKRRLQEEQERARREMEDEKLRLQQLKRKSLRDQWLMDAPTGSPDGSAPRSPLWGPQAQAIEEQIDKLQVESQRLAEERAKLEKLEEEGRALNDTGRDAISEPDAAEGKKEASASPSGPTPAPRLQKAPMQNGQEERSVLGVVQVQVEKDLKTGATTIKSVAPVAHGALECPGEVLFDDGSKSVQAAEGVAPSPEELGQVLSAVDDMGMLVEAQVIINGRKENAEEAHPAPPKENGFGEKEGEEEEIKHNACSPPPQEETPHASNASTDTTVDVAVGALEDAVTMTFLGFSVAEPGQGLDGEDAGEIIRAERVVITDDGEDQPVSEEAPPSGSTEEPSESPSNEKSDLKVTDQNLELEADSNTHTDENQDTESGVSEAVAAEEAEAKLAAEEAEAKLAAEEEGKQDTAEGESRGEGDVPRPDSTEGAVEASQGLANSTAEAGAGDVEENPATAVILKDQFQDVPLDSEPTQEGSATKPELQPLVGAAEANSTPAEQEPLVSASKAPPETSSAALSRAEGGAVPKQKSCQCCSVM
ncbi:paralemmin-3 isoform X2 [Scleropages formosus]|uniref:paralemmin-3 isoform X2 n=1 Tax=Scleropages formosus TaxID=113540 RepID=UPI0010FA93EB|nr:paralemmin-3 isoform X2 [Scleropages formosus]